MITSRRVNPRASRMAHHGGFGPRTDQTHFVDGRNQFDDQFGHLVFSPCRRTETGSRPHGFQHGFGHGGVCVTENHGPPRPDVVQIPIAVDIKQPGPFAAFEHNGLAAHRAKGSSRTVDTARNQLSSALEDERDSADDSTYRCSLLAWLATAKPANCTRPERAATWLWPSVARSKSGVYARARRRRGKTHVRGLTRRWCPARPVPVHRTPHALLGAATTAARRKCSSPARHRRQASPFAPLHHRGDLLRAEPADAGGGRCGCDRADRAQCAAVHSAPEPLAPCRRAGTSAATSIAAWTDRAVPHRPGSRMRRLTAHGGKPGGGWRGTGLRPFQVRFDLWVIPAGGKLEPCRTRGSKFDPAPVSAGPAFRGNSRVRKVRRPPSHRSPSADACGQVWLPTWPLPGRLPRPAPRRAVAGDR